MVFVLKQCRESSSYSFFRTEKVTDDLEALIDPFDLDVFTPHLNSNLNRLVQRTSVSQARISVNGAPHSGHKLNLLQHFLLQEAVLGAGKTQIAEFRD